MEVQTYQFLKFLNVLVVFLFCFVWGGGHTLQSSEFSPGSGTKLMGTKFGSAIRQAPFVLFHLFCPQSILRA